MIYLYFLFAAAFTGWISRWILSWQASSESRLGEFDSLSRKFLKGLAILVTSAGVLCAFWSPLIAFSIAGNEQGPFEVTLTYGTEFVVFLWLWLVVFPIRKNERSVNAKRSRVQSYPLTVRVSLLVIFAVGVIVLKNLSYSGKTSSSRIILESGVSSAPHK